MLHRLCVEFGPFNLTTKIVLGDPLSPVAGANESVQGDRQREYAAGARQSPRPVPKQCLTITTSENFVVELSDRTSPRVPPATVEVPETSIETLRAVRFRQTPHPHQAGAPQENSRQEVLDNPRTGISADELHGGSPTQGTQVLAKPATGLVPIGESPLGESDGPVPWSSVSSWRPADDDRFGLRTTQWPQPDSTPPSTVCSIR